MVLAVVTGSKVTLFVAFEFIRIALLVFRMATGDFVDMDDAVDPALVMVGGGVGVDPSGFKEKPGVGEASLWLSIFGPLAVPILSFLGSWKRAPLSGFA